MLVAVAVKQTGVLEALVVLELMVAAIQMLEEMVFLVLEVAVEAEAVTDILRVMVAMA